MREGGRAALAALLLAAGVVSAASPPPVRDPALLAGALPNGMRYYVRADRMPAHRAELRLVVNAGSVLEDPDQRGFAHFLEHMAFEGTRHFPGHALVDFVETSGMRFGWDLNASTTYDETVYQLTLPTDVPGTLDRGLTALQDWASGGITIDSAAVVLQRGIVMGEWRTRLRDTVAQKLVDHFDTLMFGGSPYLTRAPIGDTTLIETAEPGPIARFYHDWYRPDLTAVVAVGDFDAAAVVREIRERFGAIPEPRHPRPRPHPAPPVSRRPLVDVFRGRVAPGFELLWPAAPQPADPVAAERGHLVAQLLFQALDDRLLELREGPSRPFVTAHLERGRLIRPLDLVGVSAVLWSDSLDRGLATVAGELQRLAEHGLPPGILALRKAALLSHLEHEAKGEEARPSAVWADGYVRHYLTDEGLLISPAQELALARTILPSVTPEALARAARFWRNGTGERLLVTMPEFAHVRPPTRAGVLAVLDSVARLRLPPARDANADSSALLARRPEPGRIVAERRDTVAGLTEWTLSNGARVLFKPTQNDPDAFLMRAWGPGGFSVMPDSLFFSPGRMVAKVMTDAAGLGSRSRDLLEQRLATTGVRALSVDIGYADQSIALSGSARDLQTLFQLLYLQFTAPRLDSATLDSWQSLAKYEGAPFSIDDQFNLTFARGNPRLLPVSTRLAPLVTVPEAMAVYSDRFGNAGQFTFTLVGAATVDEVRPLVERYLASLPATGLRDRPLPPDVHPFESAVSSEVRVLQVPRAQTLMVFDAPLPAEPDSFLLVRDQLGLIATVLGDRLRERLREQLAATYSPIVFVHTYALPDPRYRVYIAFDAAPRAMRGLNRELKLLLDSLRSDGADSAELARAALIERRQRETELQDDSFWVRTIGFYDRLHVPLDNIPDPDGRALSPAEFRAAVRRYLPSDVYIHVTAMPKDSTLFVTPDGGEGSR